MEQNSLQRNLGITLSVIVACAVVIVTIIFNKSSTSSTQLADQNTTGSAQTLDQTSSASTQVSSPTSASAPTNATVSSSRTRLGSSEESGEGGSEGGENGYVPVSTPAKTPVVTTAPPAVVPKKTVVTSTSIYRNGTYSATGSYMSPGGYDQLGVTVTIVNDIITDATVTSGANDGRSQRYQDRFISGYKQYVVGKNIASVNLTNVSGASLTPIGFNDALSQIKAQAKA